MNALTPQQAAAMNDPLMDVEVECIVAKVNCILARHYEDGQEVSVQQSVFGENLYLQNNSLLKFEKAGWSVGQRTMHGITSYVFRKQV
jgi:hypothetical protein